MTLTLDFQGLIFNSHILGMGRSIDLEWKRCELDTMLDAQWACYRTLHTLDSFHNFIPELLFSASDGLLFGITVSSRHLPVKSYTQHAPQNGCKT